VRSLARYAVTNAVTRAMLPDLLTKQDFEAILRAGPVPEAWKALRKTAWGGWLAEDAPLDPMSVEKQLREGTAHRFNASIRMLKGAPKKVGALLLSRWELDSLEFALRLWHGKDPSLEAFLSCPPFVHGIPVIEIIRAQTLDEVTEALRHTPYVKPLHNSAARYQEKRSIFYVEVALEKDYYRRLLDAVKALGGIDAREGARIIGADIDLLNLAWLARLFQYYKIPAAEFPDVIVPGPSALSKELAQPAALTPDAFNALSTRFLATRMTGEGRSLSSPEQVSLLEYLVSEMSVAEARRLLARFPFSITGIFSFYLLLRVELKNLVSLFAAKACGINEADISTRLYGLG